MTYEELKSKRNKMKSVMDNAVDKRSIYYAQAKQQYSDCCHEIKELFRPKKNV